MLGWEFPPVFTGGLGVACYNIVKALHPRANIHLIVPYAEPHGNTADLNITGLNQLDKEIQRQLFASQQLESTEDIFRVPVGLPAYPSYTGFQQSDLASLYLSVENGKTILNDLSDKVFQSRNLYGPDIQYRTWL